MANGMGVGVSACATFEIVSGTGAGGESRQLTEGSQKTFLNSLDLFRIATYWGLPFRAQD